MSRHPWEPLSHNPICSPDVGKASANPESHACSECIVRMRKKETVLSVRLYAQRKIREQIYVATRRNVVHINTCDAIEQTK
jgi:hypothetical protein